MPKVKMHHERNSLTCKQAQPYPQSNELFAKPQRSVNNKNQNKLNQNPVSADNVVKCFMKCFKSKSEATKKASLEISEKMQKTKMAAVESKQETSQLKKRLSEMEQQGEDLKDQIKKLQQEVDVFKNKCVTANLKYTQLETGYDEKLTNLQVEKSKLQSANNKQIEDLQQKLKTTDEHFQQMITQLQSEVQEKSVQLDKLQLEHTQLQQHSGQMGAAFEQEKLQLEYKFEGLLEQKEVCIF
ncbi:mitotic spindle assembly checkpoint protein MAD1-like [Drosophila innubila]|uniref:mitotic spindle assembly checkpoint protein MAD1-like n=1 Tax=Drosophila innubila TaxID=198719 RepID=UPI00148E10FE|nr:mitotic spindle assembly checkpoint protein MAD1-like [Drosophila innubila]